MKEPTHIITESREDYIKRKNKDLDNLYFVLSVMLIMAGIGLIRYDKFGAGSALIICGVVFCSFLGFKFWKESKQKVA